MSTAASGPRLVYEFGFGYSGTPLHYVNQQSALGICGNSLMYYSLQGGQNKQLIWGPGYGIQITAYSPVLDYLAYALKVRRFHFIQTLTSFSSRQISTAVSDLKPQVHIYDCSNYSNVAQLSGSASSDSLVLTPYTREFMLKILWNIDREQRTVTKLIEGQTGWSAMGASFSPVSADRVCISGNGNLTLWTYHRSFHRVSFTGKPLVAGTCVPQSHTWATHSDIIYVGCREGELLTFTVKPPDPPKIAATPSKEKESKGRKADKEKEKEQKERDENEDVKAKEPEFKWRCLIVLDDPAGPVTHMCARDGHLVVVGDGGHMRWVTVPKEPVEKKKKEGGKKSRKRRKKGKREGKEDKAKADDSEDVRSDDSSLEKEARVVCELSLNVPEVRTMEYREDGLQLLIGASNGLIATVRVNQQILEPQLSASSTDLLPTLTSMERGAEIEWESEHHEGAVMALGFIRGAKFMVTAGKDTTVRVWTSDRGKEVSRTYLKAAQTCMSASEKNNVVVTGAANGFINVLKVDQIGRSTVVFSMKLHTRSLDQISFSVAENYVVTASKADARFFFCTNKSGDFENLELLGYITLPNPILAHTWDAPAEGSSDLFVLLSLARGEIVKLKVPVEKAPNGGLVYDDRGLRQQSFRIPIPLNAIATGKYYLEKEEVERRVVWGFGSDKKLQQYKLPDNYSAWTGSDAMPHAAHFNIPGHLKPGNALVLCTFDGVLVTGGEDGAIQIRTQVFDPLQAPQKSLDVRLYDGFTGGVSCAAVVNGRIYCGGTTGVIFCCDTSQCGLRRGKQSSAGDLPPRTKTTRVKPEPDDGQVEELSVVQKHEQNVEARYMLAGQPYRASLTSKFQQIKQAFHLIYEANEMAPQLEKLTPKELLVDTDLEVQLRNKLHKAVSEIVEKVKVGDVKKDILVERIKAECYESMADPELILMPFCTGHPVRSFPIRKAPGFSVRLGTLVKQLRIIEMREMHYIKQLNKQLAKEAALQAEKEAELAAQAASENAAFASSRLGGSSGSDAFGGDLTSRTRDSLLEGEFPAEDGRRPPEQQVPSTGQEAGALPGSRRASVSGGTRNRDTEAESGGALQGLEDTPAAATTPSLTMATTVDDDDDDVELSLTETAPAESFLYGTFELTTSKRKRLQRFLLFMQLHEMRLAFNAKVAAARQNKVQLIQKIHEYQVRIKDLYRMLGGQGECPLLVINESIQGMPDIFQIKDEEVTVKKYLNKAERAKAEEMRLLDEEQAKLQAKSNAAQRALLDMMGGKLEKKVEIIAVEQEVQRPAWMSGNPKGFTKEQHKEIKEFDLYLKQLKEEKEKKIRAQESEQRKLMNDIQEMTASFDKEILDLFNQRCQVTGALSRAFLTETPSSLCIENFYSIFGCRTKSDVLPLKKPSPVFSVQVETEEFSDEKREFDLSKTMEKLKSAKAQSVSALTEFRREVDAFREEYEAAVAEDKLQDKSFRKNFSDCGDQINELYKAFQRRPMKPAELQPKEKKANAGLPERRGSLKPAQVRRGSLMGPPRKPVTPAVIIDPFYEKPPEVTQGQWERLMEARSRKMTQEEDVKRLTVTMTEMQSCLNELTAADDTNRRKIEYALRELADRYDEENESVQGRESSNQVGDCSAATPAAAPSQMVIKTGEDPTTASETLALVNRLEHNNKLQEKRKADKEFILKQLMAKSEILKKQREELTHSAEEVRAVFEFQNRLCSNKLAQISKGSSNNQRFQILATERKLRDLVREQADQMELLERELNETRAHMIPLLPGTQPIRYDFPHRPKTYDFAQRYFEPRPRDEQAEAL
ncbi:hypothetical protein R1sor_011647 [Riccia sorocarpa]|uniref:Cilia- and flagella-associated protein 43 n=1 Tax=Riccia sorocarpa TaxID=122646 RepID=A0ABD3I5R7_9MARC